MSNSIYCINMTHVLYLQEEENKNEIVLPKCFRWLHTQIIRLESFCLNSTVCVCQVHVWLCFRVKFRENLNSKNNWFWMTLVYTERLEKRKAPLEISIGIYVWTDGSLKVISNGLCELLNNVDTGKSNDFVSKHVPPRVHTQRQGRLSGG